MPDGKQRDVVALILVIIVSSLVSLAALSGAMVYVSVRNESVNTLRQKNRALVNAIDGRISLKRSLVEQGAMMLRDPGFGQVAALAHLAAVAEAEADMSDVYMGFPDGSGLSGSGMPTPPGWVSRERPWYMVAVERPGEVAFTAPYMDTFRNEMVFSAVRTVSDSGDELGVVAVSVPFAIMAGYVGYDFGIDGSFSVIIAADGSILLHPDPALAPLDDFTFPNKAEIYGGRYA